MGVWQHCVLVFLLRQIEGAALSLCESLRTFVRGANYPHTPNPQQQLKPATGFSSLLLPQEAASMSRGVKLLRTASLTLQEHKDLSDSQRIQKEKCAVCQRPRLFLTAPTQDVIKAHRFLFFLTDIHRKIPGFFGKEQIWLWLRCVGPCSSKNVSCLKTLFTRLYIERRLMERISENMLLLIENEETNGGKMSCWLFTKVPQCQFHMSCCITDILKIQNKHHQSQTSRETENNEQ